MIKLFDRVKEKSSTKGRGDLYLERIDGAYDQFSDRYEDKDQLYYCVTDNKNYEIGIGTYRNSRLIRDEVLSSSRDNEKINWGPGYKEVYPAYPASKNTYTRDAIQDSFISFWKSDNELSFLSGVQADSGNFTVPEASFNNVASGYLMYCGDFINFLDYEIFRQFDPYLETETLPSTRLDDVIAITGDPSTAIGFEKQEPNTIFSTSGITDYPTFRSLIIDDLPNIDAEKVDYTPVSGSSWRNIPTNAQEGFDELSNEIYLQLDEFPETTFASGGNVDTLDFLDATDFALVDHVHENLFYAKMVDTERDFNNAISEVVEQEEIFDSFYRFSHRDNNVFPSVPSETGQWTFDNETKIVASIINSTSFIGFVSDTAFSNYTLEATLRSNAGPVNGGAGNGNFRDNDQIGLIIAFHIDPQTQVESTLSVIVNREVQSTFFKDGFPTAASLAIVYNHRQADARILAREEVWWLANPELVPAGDQTVTPWYLEYPGGIRIKVERDGDNVKVFRSDFSDAENLRTDFLSVDLSQDLDLLKFQGQRPYGFCCYSQFDSQFIDISFSDASNAIYNLLDGQVYEYNEIDTEWQPNPDRSIGEFGRHKFVFNQNTKKLFFLLNDNIDDAFSPNKKLDQIRQRDIGIEIGNFNYLEESDYFYETRSGVMKINESGMVGISAPFRQTEYDNPAKIGQSTNDNETDNTEPSGSLPRDMYTFRIVDESGIHLDVNVDGVVKSLDTGFVE